MKNLNDFITESVNENKISVYGVGEVGGNPSNKGHQINVKDAKYVSISKDLKYCQFFTDEDIEDMKNDFGREDDIVRQLKKVGDTYFMKDNGDLFIKIA